MLSSTAASECPVEVSDSFCVTGGCAEGASLLLSFTNGSLQLGSAGQSPCTGRGVGAVLTPRLTLIEEPVQGSATLGGRWDRPLQLRGKQVHDRGLQSSATCTPLAAGAPVPTVYAPGSQCSWIIAPTEIDTSTGQGVRNSHITLQLTHVDLAPGDTLSLTVSGDARQPDAENTILVLAGTSLPGSEVVRGLGTAQEIEAWVEQVSGLQAAGADTSALKPPSHESFDSTWKDVSLTTSSGYMRVFLNGQNGGGAGIRGVYNSHRPESVNYYFVAAVAVSVSAGVIVLACIGHRYWQYRRRAADAREAERELGLLDTTSDEEETDGDDSELAVPASVLVALPTFKFDSDKMAQTPLKGLEKEDLACAISLAEYSEGDAITVLPCGHHFLHESILHWLKSKKMCPMCKRDVLETWVLYSSKAGADDGPGGAQDPLALGPGVHRHVNPELKSQADRERDFELGVESTAQRRSRTFSNASSRGEGGAGETDTALSANMSRTLPESSTGAATGFGAAAPRRGRRMRPVVLSPSSERGSSSEDEFLPVSIPNPLRSAVHHGSQATLASGPLPRRRGPEEGSSTESHASTVSSLGSIVDSMSGTAVISIPSPIRQQRPGPATGQLRQPRHQGRMAAPEQGSIIDAHPASPPSQRSVLAIPAGAASGQRRQGAVSDVRDQVNPMMVRTHGRAR